MPDKILNTELSKTLLTTLLKGQPVQLFPAPRHGWFPSGTMFYVPNGDYPNEGLFPATNWWEMEGNVEPDNKPPYILCYHFAPDHILMYKSFDAPWIMPLISTIKELKYKPTGMRIHRPNEQGTGRIEIRGETGPDADTEFVAYHEDDEGPSVTLSCLDLWAIFAAIASYSHNCVLPKAPHVRTHLSFNDLIS